MSTKVAPRVAGADAVANELGSLSLSDAPVVYEAEWRTKVQFESETPAGTKAPNGPVASAPVSYL